MKPDSPGEICWASFRLSTSARLLGREMCSPWSRKLSEHWRGGSTIESDGLMSITAVYSRGQDGRREDEKALGLRRAVG